MRGRVLACLAAVALTILLIGAAGALNGSRACGKFDVYVKVTGTGLAAVSYETCFSRSKANDYAAFAKGSDDGFHPAELKTADSARIEVPFSDVESFFGLRVKHVQPKYAVVVLAFDAGPKLVRILDLPTHGSHDITMLVKAD